MRVSHNSNFMVPSLLTQLRGMNTFHNTLRTKNIVDFKAANPSLHQLNALQLRRWGFSITKSSNLCNQRSDLSFKIQELRTGILKFPGENTCGCSLSHIKTEIQCEYLQISMKNIFKYSEQGDIHHILKTGIYFRQVQY